MHAGHAGELGYGSNFAVLAGLHHVDLANGDHADPRQGQTQQGDPQVVLYRLIVVLPLVGFGAVHN